MKNWEIKGCTSAGKSGKFPKSIWHANLVK